MNHPASNDPHSDIEVLRRVAGRDTEALGVLYDRFAPTLFGIAVRMIGNEGEAEDVLQDVFLKIWDKAHTYDSKLGSPIAWLITLLRNQAHDKLRARSRHLRVLDRIEHSEDTQLHAVPSPTQSMMGAEVAQAIRTALQELPPDQRQAIELAFFYGLTQTEIATRLQQPLGTIKARIRRGMMTLRDHLPADWLPGDLDTSS